MRRLKNITLYPRKTSFCCRQKNMLTFMFYSNNLEYILLLICCLNILNVHGFAQSNVRYVDECRTDCVRLKDPLTCGKHRIVRWIHNFTITKDINYGSLRFVRLSSAEEEEPVRLELPKLRSFTEHSEFLNFVQSSVEDMLTNRALVYTVEQPSSARSLSSGPAILDSDEFDAFVELGRSAEERLHRKKKKLSIVLPLLILLKLFKLKLMVIPILIGVHFIKKILLLGLLAVSSLLSNLKYCRIPPVTHHPVSYSTWATAAETPIDYSIASGHEDDGWSQKIDTVGYDAFVANFQRNPYRAYLQAMKQQQQQLQNTI